MGKLSLRYFTDPDFIFVTVSHLIVERIITSVIFRQLYKFVRLPSESESLGVGFVSQVMVGGTIEAR